MSPKKAIFPNLVFNLQKLKISGSTSHMPPKCLFFAADFKTSEIKRVGKAQHSFHGIYIHVTSPSMAFTMLPLHCLIRLDKQDLIFSSCYGRQNQLFMPLCSHLFRQHISLMACTVKAGCIALQPLSDE